MTGDELSGEQLTLQSLSAQLAQALGEEKARDVIANAAADMGLPGPSVTRQQALDVLEEVAETPGIVGVCARFARTRVMLASVSLPAKR